MKSWEVLGLTPGAGDLAAAHGPGTPGRSESPRPSGSTQEEEPLGEQGHSPRRDPRWTPLEQHVNRLGASGDNHRLSDHLGRVRVHLVHPRDPHTALRIRGTGEAQGDGQHRLCIRDLRAKGYVLVAKNFMSREWCLEDPIDLSSGGAMVAITSASDSGGWDGTPPF